jgi:hypothetical protein
MACTQCYQNNTPCTCNQVITPCNNCPPEVVCDCPIKDLDLKCTVYNGQALPNSGVLPSDNGQVVVIKLDKYIKLIFDTLNIAFNLINTGLGAKIYSGIDTLGKRKLRTLESSDTSVLIQELPDTINITTVLPPLEKVNEGNGNGIIIRGRNPLFFGNVGQDAVDLSYNFITNTRGATGRGSFTTGVNTYADGQFSAAMGRATEATGYASVALGEGGVASGRGATSIGHLSEASNFYSFAWGETCASSGYGSMAGGIRNTANSEGEVSIGKIGTIGVNRLFNIGNGTVVSSIDNPRDAFSVFFNGIALLPSVTNVLIDSANSKAIITKEYLQGALASGMTTVVSGNASTTTPFKVEVAPSIISQINTNTTAINNITSTGGLFQVGDLKMIDVSDLYVTQNFDSSGLGINLRIGWAICNGNNGTKDRRGTIPLSYDDRIIDPTNGIWDNLYRFLGTIVGLKRVLLTGNESGVQPHTHPGIPSNAGQVVPNTGSGDYFVGFGGATQNSANLPALQSHENRQPSMVTLFIQKI